jgi:hypothetical protein
MNKRLVAARLLGLLFLFLVVVGGLGAMRVAATRTSERRSNEGLPHGARPESRHWPEDTLQAFYDSLTALEARIPPEAIELNALASKLGNDPQNLVRFVSDSIRYEHYDGVLRGAFGTLISRSGNSCDQALFLRELLAAHGISSSLRVMPADSALNAALVERALRQAPSTPAEAAAGARDSLQAEVEIYLDRLASAAPGFSAALLAPATARPIKNYCWVQAEIADNRQELDPLATSQVRVGAQTHASVPDFLRFEFAVSVVLDAKKDGRNETTVLTSATFAADTIRLDPILISVVPERVDLLDSLNVGDDVGALLRKFDTFYPVVSFREEHLVDKGFNLAGEVVELSEGEVLAEGAELGGRLDDMLGRGVVSQPQRGEVEEEPVAQAKLMNLRLKYEIRAPDGTIEDSQRQLIDFDPSSSSPSHPGRLAASIVKQKQVLIATFAASRWYLARRLIDFFRQNRGALESLARVDGEIGEKPPRLLTYPFQLLLLSMAQDGASLHLNNVGQGVLFRGRPEVLVLKQEFAVDSAGARRTDGIDIVSTGFEALSPAGRERGLRAMMGIYSSLFEILALGNSGAESLLSLLKQAQEKNIPAVTLAGTNDPQLEEMQLTSLQRYALQEELRAGRIVVTLARPVPKIGALALGWWRLDPGTGEVLAILENREGGAQAGTEYKLVKATIAGAVAGAASGYVVCLWTSSFTAEGVAWPGFQGRNGACVVAASCGALFGAILGALSYGVYPGSWVATNPWTGGPWEFLAYDPRILWVFVPATAAEATAGGAFAGGLGGSFLPQFCRFADL